MNFAVYDVKLSRMAFTWADISKCMQMELPGKAKHVLSNKCYQVL